MRSGVVDGWSAPSLVDALYRAIREHILNGEEPGGTPLTEMDIATRYSVARPTAKAAMERLVHEGLLRRSNNKTARIPILDSNDIRDLYFSRGFLERGVMATLAQRRFVPEAAVQSLEVLRNHVDDPVVMTIVEADTSFHRALVDAVGSPRLNRLYASLAGEVHLCMAQVQAHGLLHPSRIAREHAGILEAIRKGDPEKAVVRITQHLDRACTRLVAFLDEGNDPSAPTGPS